MPSADFKPVVDACTLCDMCFMTKCPYVPPHDWALDFPHLMLRYRAVEAKKTGVPFALRQLTETDRNGTLARPVAALANWASAESNGLTRPLLEKVAGVHREAHLPEFHGRTLVMRAKADPPPLNTAAPAYGRRKAVLYATCFANYNNPAIGMAMRGILARNGVETEVVYPACCGMPQLEQGDLQRVNDKAAKVAEALAPWIDRGYDIVALVPSCALMLKMEWPLIVPQDAPHRSAVERLAQATFDASEYIVDIARREGLAEGLQPVPGGVSLHIACHARAQNMGQKAAEMLRLIPQADLKVIERCSGHGGSWGIMTENFPTALKVGKPVATQAAKAGKAMVASECPLAGAHIRQGIERQGGAGATQQVPELLHPLQIFARAYGLAD
ncbi:heterodisulfide reductase-related iron-sulfur binding cluster [Azospirillum thermophilum]|uniref:heterodisulfide reductase-related iron-sulfur binding cluster n=1 Tax=Azospirillum thermophilum TaxID=2202148 RepID=UPI001FE39C99|nr:heterodisulfide reductase-related iron-sulfur binding cluster [Azospirillum thermophilum]